MTSAGPIPLDLAPCFYQVPIQQVGNRLLTLRHWCTIMMGYNRMLHEHKDQELLTSIPAPDGAKDDS